MILLFASQRQKNTYRSNLNSIHINTAVWFKSVFCISVCSLLVLLMLCEYSINIIVNEPLAYVMSLTWTTSRSNNCSENDLFIAQQQLAIATTTTYAAMLCIVYYFATMLNTNHTTIFRQKQTVKDELATRAICLSSLSVWVYDDSTNKASNRNLTPHRCNK